MIYITADMRTPPSLHELLISNLTTKCDVDSCRLMDETCIIVEYCVYDTSFSKGAPIGSDVEKSKCTLKEAQAASEIK